ncbi:hypothetical protein BC830DRAFT_1132658 [Chytriomyces sp. MP71]|nr:hypothetical protein BC830DRAFT_1132658 [Chytriomyces sp. MP71]
MKFDAHKAKASRQWQKKQQSGEASGRSAAKAAAVVTRDGDSADACDGLDSARYGRRKLGSNAFRFAEREQDEEDQLDGSADAQTRALRELVEAARLEDASAVSVAALPSTYFSLEEYGNTDNASDEVFIERMEERRRSYDRSSTLTFAQMYARLMALDLHQLNDSLAQLPLHVRLGFDEALLEHDTHTLAMRLAPPLSDAAVPSFDAHADSESQYAQLLKAKQVSKQIHPSAVTKTMAAIPASPSATRLSEHTSGSAGDDELDSLLSAAAVAKSVTAKPPAKQTKTASIPPATRTKSSSKPEISLSKASNVNETDELDTLLALESPPLSGKTSTSGIKANHGKSSTTSSTSNAKPQKSRSTEADDMKWLDDMLQ